MCLYCENEENEHFCCLNCNIGMCGDCYDFDVEHTGHLFDYHEAIEDEAFYSFIQYVVSMPYGYLCYDCLGKLRKEFEKAIKFKDAQKLKRIKSKILTQKNKGGINKK